MCLKKIDAPLAMHELVKQALTKAMASNSHGQILTLLDKLSSEQIISEDQFAKVIIAHDSNSVKNLYASTGTKNQNGCISNV